MTVEHKAYDEEYQNTGAHGRTGERSQAIAHLFNDCCRLLANPG